MTVSPRLGRLATLSIAMALLATAAAAQQTRTEAIEQAQAAKASTLAPYVPGTIERILDQTEKGAWLDPKFLRGFYPTFSSIYPGGGFTVGAGYRAYTGYYSHVDLRGLVSLSGFAQVEASAAAPRMAGGAVDLTARVGWRDAARIPFFGLGPASVADDRTNARVTEVYAEGAALYRPATKVFLRGATSYEAYTEQTATGRIRSVETRFDQLSAPRLGEDPAFVHLQSQVGLYWLESPFYSRRGGFYRGSYDQYLSADGGENFAMARTDLVQHVPVLRETWVLSLRGRTESVVGRNAPYFMMPSLGDGNSLRGYSTARFRDRHTALASAEWRWIPNRAALDLALFVDAGTVARELDALSMRELKTDYGIGVRFHTLSATVLRLDLARGSEGWRVVFGTSAPF